MAHLKKIFNTNSGKVEDANLTIDRNGEVVATFKDGSFLKFPAGLTTKEFDKLITEHEKQNKDQIPVAKLEEQLSELADKTVEDEFVLDEPEE